MGNGESAGDKSPAIRLAELRRNKLKPGVIMRVKGRFELHCHNEAGTKTGVTKIAR